MTQEHITELREKSILFLVTQQLMEEHLLKKMERMKEHLESKETKHLVTEGNTNLGEDCIVKNFSTKRTGDARSTDAAQLVLPGSMGARFLGGGEPGT